MTLEARPVDPRDVSTEVDNPTFRLYYWRTSPGLSSREYELTGADVDEVIDWAEGNRGDNETYVLGTLTYQCGPHGEDLVFTRIKGTDPSRADDAPRDDRHMDDRGWREPS